MSLEHAEIDSFTRRLVHCVDGLLAGDEKIKCAFCWYEDLNESVGTHTSREEQGRIGYVVMVKRKEGREEWTRDEMTEKANTEKKKRVWDPIESLIE